MRLAFLGGATTVTGSQFLLTTDRARVLIDCGLFQGSPNEAARNRLPLTFDPSELDAILLTHAHLDHCGFTPVLVREGFRGPIHLTRASAELARLVLLDSGKVQAEQARNRRERTERLARKEGDATSGGGASVDGTRAPGRPPDASPPDTRAMDVQRAGAEGGGDIADQEADLRAAPPELETDIERPLYTVDDAEAAVQLFSAVDYEQPVAVAPGMTATFYDAGHILGSAIIAIDAQHDDGSVRRVVFSGDVGRPGTPILRDPTRMMDGADYVLMESTYGGREHAPADEAIRLLAEAVNVVAEHSGVLLIPAFAIGRTQEIVWELDRLLSAGRIPHLPLYLDSPMASRASDIYSRFDGYYDEETYALLQAGETPLDYPDEIITNDAAESKAIRDAPRPMMIIAASGMLTGGRIVHHLRDLIDDPAALLLFVGYQGEGTLGAHLQAGARQVRLDGHQREVRCQVRSLSGFSAHADEKELLDWLGHLARATRRPRKVFLVHGDPEATEALEPRIRELGLTPYRPGWREVVELD